MMKNDAKGEILNKPHSVWILSITAFQYANRASGSLC